MNEETEGLFLESYNEVSGRYAILEDDGRCAWLYLTCTDAPRPDKDCFVYSPVEPVETLDLDGMKNDGLPPVLLQSVASNSAVWSQVEPDALDFVWGADGESVAVTYAGKPVAMIARDGKRGYSRALAEESFFGLPWDEAVFAACFDSATRTLDAPGNLRPEASGDGAELG